MTNTENTASNTDAPKPTDTNTNTNTNGNASNGGAQPEVKLEPQIVNVDVVTQLFNKNFEQMSLLNEKLISGLKEAIQEKAPEAKPEADVIKDVEYQIK